LHIAVLITLALCVAFLSFVPRWASLMFNDSVVIWKLSTSILLVVHILTWIITFLFARGLKVILVEFPPLEKYLSVSVMLIGVCLTYCEISLLLVTMSIGLASFVYQSVLILFLAITFLNFFSLLLVKD